MDGTEPLAGPAGRPPGLLRRLYREERQAWKTCYRRYFKYAARALGLGFVAGFVYFMVWPAQQMKALDLVAKALKDIPMEAPPLARAISLFVHNARASLLPVVAGVIPFIPLPILDPVLNGGALGLLVSIARHQGLDVPRLVLTQILPHGVVELPAILYATSIGLYLSAGTGRLISAAWKARRRRRNADPVAAPGPEPGGPGPGCLVRNAVRSFVLVILPLLAVAAYIEAYITPTLR